MTQGGAVLPTIFNVVVELVVRHWESLMEERAGGDIRKMMQHSRQRGQFGQATGEDGGQRRSIRV